MTLPFPIQFASNGPQWAQGFDAWYDYTKPQGSQLLAFPPATDTHSATVYAQSSSGVWQAIPANVPSRTDLGLQTVPTRTNSIRNNSMSGAVAGVIGSGGVLPTNWAATAAGLTRTIVGTGTENGLPYIDYRLSGTTGSTASQIIFETSTSTAAVTGQVWTESTFNRLVGGTLNNISSVNNTIYEWNAVGTYINENNAAFVPTASMQRASLTTTLDGGVATAFVSSAVQLFYSVGVAIDVTIRIYAPQLEGNNVSFASQPILTTSAAATVNGNQQVIDLTGRLASGVGGIVQINVLFPETANTPITFNNGISLGEALRLVYNSGVLQWQTRTGLGSYFGVDLAPASASTVTIAFASSENFLQARVVGQSQPTALTTEAYPSGLSKVNIGGIGINSINTSYQLTRRLALRFGPQNATTFADLFAKAQILAAVSQ
jgi:hypothetical protein